jgi:hypothetical protein
MPYAVACRSTDTVNRLRIDADAVPPWSGMPTTVVDRLTQRLPRLLFGAVDVTIAATPPVPPDKPEVVLACRVPPHDVLRPWREAIADRVGAFLRTLDAGLADRGRVIRVDLRRALSQPACHAPWASARPGVATDRVHLAAPPTRAANDADADRRGQVAARTPERADPATASRAARPHPGDGFAGSGG